MESFMVREGTIGPMAHATKVNSWKECVTVRAAGSQQFQMEIFTLDLMKMIRKMVMEDMFGRMAAFMKVVFPRMLSNDPFYLGRAKED